MQRNHPLASKAKVQFGCRGVLRVGLRADVDRQFGNFRAQKADRAGIRHNGRVHAAFRGFPRRCGKAFQFIVEGIGIHRNIEPFAGCMRQADSVPQLLRTEIARKSSQTEVFHPAVDRVCSEVQRSLERVHISRRCQQFRNPHHWIPLSWSYFCHFGA